MSYIQSVARSSRFSRESDPTCLGLSTDNRAAQHVATYVAMYVPRYIANTPLGYTHRSDRTVTTTYPALLEATNKKPTFSY
jgi:hypothetical protein